MVNKIPEEIFNSYGNFEVALQVLCLSLYHCNVWNLTYLVGEPIQYINQTKIPSPIEMQLQQLSIIQTV